MNKAMQFVVAGTAMAASFAVTPAMAGGGIFDALDPCIQQTDNFHDTRLSYLRQLDQKVSDADNEAVTPQYRVAWMAAKRAQLRPSFDADHAPMLREAGVTDLEPYYTKYFDKKLAQVGPQNVEKLVAANFHQELKQVRIEDRTSGNADLVSAQQELDKSCKMDVGNQALRGALTTVLAPVELISRNLEIAKRESGAGAQALAVTTGISVGAIEKNGGVFGGGLSGGENSFFRKNLGIRF